MSYVYKYDIPFPIVAFFVHNFFHCKYSLQHSDNQFIYTQCPTTLSPEIPACNTAA